MARIELRNATIRLVDGHSNTSLVNGAVSVGATAMAIDGLGTAAIIPVSSRFTVTGVTGQFTVLTQDANSHWTLDLEIPTAGTFDLTLNTETASGLAFDIDASTLLTAIEALASVTVDDITVTGSGTTADPFVIKTTSSGGLGDKVNTMTIDGSGLTAADTEVFVVVEVGGSTHDLTFSPVAPSGGFADDVVITHTGRQLEVKVGDGNVTYTENRAYLYDLERGIIDTVRQDDDVPMDVTIDFTWEFLTAITGAITPTIEDVLNFRGPASSWVSSSADPCEPDAIDIEIEHEQPCLDTEKEFIVLKDYRWETLDHNIDDAAVSSTGRCNITNAVLTRSL